MPQSTQQLTHADRMVLRNMSNRMRYHRTRRHRMGAATIEMALVAPFVLFLIFCSIEFSRMMMVRQAMTNAAREGCRRAALVTTRHHDDAEDVIREQLAGVIANSSNSSIVRIVIDPPFITAPASGTRVSVNVEVDCEDVSWMPTFLFQGIEIRTFATMFRE